MCRRGIRKITSYEKLHGAWLQKWSQTPKYAREDMDQTVHTLKKILVYYPKNMKLLNSKVSCCFANSKFEPKSQKYFSQIFSRYKREFFRHCNANLSSGKFPIWRICQEINVLKLFQFRYDTKSNFNHSLGKMLTTNTNLQVLELGKTLNCLEEVLSHMKYIRTLKSLYLGAIPCLSLERYKRALFASSQTLESVTLRGILVQDFMEWTGVELVGLIKLILEFPNLKRFNFDVQVAENLDLDINQIPFSILKKRRIAYNIRLLTSQENLLLSGATESGLEPLEFLGINGTQFWHDYKPVWNVFQEEQLKAQEKAHSVLFVSIFKMPRADIFNLLTTCRNITTLDISLSIKSHVKGVSFAGLKGLKNLQNLFLTIDNVVTYPDFRWPSSTPRCCSSNLFENLVFCAKTIRLLSIHLCGRITYNSDRHILTFLKECSKTLTQFTLIRSYQEYTPVDRINRFYKGLALLNNLHSLNLLYVDYTYTTKTPAFEKIILNQNLRELYLSTAKIADAQVNLPILPHLEKLGIEICSPDSNADIFVQLSNLICLKDLEIKFENIEIYYWYKLLGAVGKLKLLETLKLKCNLNSTNEKDGEKILKIALKDLDLVKKNHPKLRSIAFYQAFRFTDKVWLFGRSMENWRSSVASFMGRNDSGIPRRRVYSVYSV